MTKATKRLLQDLVAGVAKETPDAIRIKRTGYNKIRVSIINKHGEDLVIICEEAVNYDGELIITDINRAFEITVSG